MSTTGEPEVTVSVTQPEENQNDSGNDTAVVAAVEASHAAAEAESASMAARTAASDTNSAADAANDAANAATTGAEIAAEAADEAVSAAELIVNALNDLPGKIADALTAKVAEAKAAASAPPPVETGPTQEEITASDKPPQSQHWLMKPVGRKRNG